MLSIPMSLKEKNIPLREFISDVVMSLGNQRFLLTNLQAQIRDVTLWYQSGLLLGLFRLSIIL
jgi:hypothetical protein